MRKILIYIVGFLIIQCTGSAKEKSSGILFGWVESPETILGEVSMEKNPKKEYFYMKITGKASSESTDKKDGVGMQSSCRESTRLMGSAEILKIFVFEYTKPFCPTSSEDSNECQAREAFFSEVKGTVKGIQSIACKPMGTVEGGTEKTWAECECTLIFKFPEGETGAKKKAENLSK